MSGASFRAVSTHVGSFPHTDAGEVVGRLLDRFPRMPAWPQLPRRDFRESMYVQYTEGLPGVVLDRERERLFFRVDDGFYEGLEGFYAAVVAEDVGPFAISAEFAAGLDRYLGAVAERGRANGAWHKGQVTGPFSFAMTVTDESKRSIQYHPELHEVAVQGISMKARWMARRMREVSERVLITLDEPYLCSFGSAFVNVPREEVVEALDAAIGAIHAEGALAGIHCCGNTDWSIPLETSADVLNLDAYEFFQGLPLYPDDLGRFLERGGNVAWGIVPTGDAARGLGAGRLLETLDERVGQLVDKGLPRDRLFRQSLLTPSCGMGTKDVEQAEQVDDLLSELSRRVREREGFE